MNDPSYDGDHPSGEPMPDSESDEWTEEKLEWLEELPPLQERILEVEQLPAWCKTAMVRYELGFYETLEEAAEDFDRTLGTFANWRATPAGRKWKEILRDLRDDPAHLAEAQLASSLHEMTADFLTAFKGAVAAGDHSEVRKYWETINDRLPDGLSETVTGGDDMGSMIQINISGGEVEGDSEFEVIEAEWDELEPDD